MKYSMKVWTAVGVDTSLHSGDGWFHLCLCMPQRSLCQVLDTGCETQFTGPDLWVGGHRVIIPQLERQRSWWHHSSPGLNPTVFLLPPPPLISQMNTKLFPIIRLSTRLGGGGVFKDHWCETGSFICFLCRAYTVHTPPCWNKYRINTV